MGGKWAPYVEPVARVAILPWDGEVMTLRQPGEVVGRREQIIAIRVEIPEPRRTGEPAIVHYITIHGEMIHQASVRFAKRRSK